MRLTLILTLLASINLRGQEIKVAIASSTIGLMTDMAKHLENEHNLDIELIPGASGTLAHQILNGAPYDILISADKKYCQILMNAEVARSSQFNVFYGKLILWTKEQLKIGDSDLPIILKNKLNEEQEITFGIANPKIAPYGSTAMSWLKAQNLDNDIKNLIIGNNVSLVNQYIFTEAVDMAITSSSSTVRLDKTSGNWYKLDDNRLTRVSHCVSLITNNEAAQRVADYFNSESIQGALKQYGYVK